MRGRREGEGGGGVVSGSWAGGWAYRKRKGGESDGWHRCHMPQYVDLLPLTHHDG